ncbi:hypothetical protein [Pseudomonas izuensis]|uniref:hypothetical protein n=1 Tax=Pseudomonas izuensis TaxID=2684212 RepID=UPI00135C8A29|nr:hypothetical protein [Pseudomonas izuensis]
MPEFQLQTSRGCWVSIEQDTKNNQWLLLGIGIENEWQKIVAVDKNKLRELISMLDAAESKFCRR